MRSHGLSFLTLATFTLLLSILTNISVAISPTWLIRTTASTSALENTCQCDCCYPVGSRGRTECIPPIDTSFDVPVCSKCDVEACAARFPVACAQSSSIVNADCITRKGWMLRLVPIFFIAVSVSLLCYGFFFKKFDGYHDDSVQPTAPILRDVIQQPYNTFSQTYNSPIRPSVANPLDKSGARSSSVLPPILETEELSGNGSPYGDESPTPHSSLAQQPNAPPTEDSNPQ